MALRFTSFKILPHLEINAPGGFDLYWAIADNTFTPTFQIHIADTESGPWTAVGTPTSAFQALNVGPPRINVQGGMLTWFKIDVLQGTTVKLTSPPMDCRARMERQQYLYYREQLRRWRLFFNKTNCLPGWLVRRKIFGSRCPECTSQTLKSTPASNECNTCYGTGIVGGYFSPVAMRADWSSSTSPRTNNQTIKEAPGPQTIQRLRIKLYAVPDAKSEDLWFDAGTGTIYLVEKVDPEMWCGSTVTQTADISRLPPHHPAYRLARPS